MLLVCASGAATASDPFEPPALDLARVWQYQSIVPSTVSPVCVASSTWLRAPQELPRHPTFLPLNAQLIRVLRHCSAESGPSSWHPLCAHSFASFTR